MPSRVGVEDGNILVKVGDAPVEVLIEELAAVAAGSQRFADPARS